MPMTIDELKTEIVAALAVLVSLIRGLEDLQKVSLSAPALDAVGKALADYVRRRSFLNLVVNALGSVDIGISKLEADGYPALANHPVLADVFAELQEQQDDIAAAIGEFEREPTATAITVSLGQATDKP